MVGKSNGKGNGNRRKKRYHGALKASGESALPKIAVCSDGSPSVDRDPLYDRHPPSIDRRVVPVVIVETSKGRKGGAREGERR